MAIPPLSLEARHHVRSACTQHRVTIGATATPVSTATSLSMPETKARPCLMIGQTLLQQSGCCNYRVCPQIHMISRCTAVSLVATVHSKPVCQPYKRYRFGGVHAQSFGPTSWLTRGNRQRSTRDKVSRYVGAHTIPIRLSDHHVQHVWA